MNGSPYSGSPVSRLGQGTPAAAVRPKFSCVICGSELRIVPPVAEELLNIAPFKQVLNDGLLDRVLQFARTLDVKTPQHGFHFLEVILVSPLIPQRHESTHEIATGREPVIHPLPMRIVFQAELVVA